MLNRKQVEDYLKVNIETIENGVYLFNNNAFGQLIADIKGGLVPTNVIGKPDRIRETAWKYV